MFNISQRYVNNQSNGLLKKSLLNSRTKTVFLNTCFRTNLNINIKQNNQYSILNSTKNLNLKNIHSNIKNHSNNNLLSLSNYIINFTQSLNMVSNITNPTAEALLNWNYTPDELRKLTDKLIEDGKKFDKQIEEIPDDECSFETVIAPLGRKTENEVEVIEANIDFFQHVSPDKDLRDASAECSLKLQEFSIERSMNKKIYQKVAKVLENIENGKFKAPENPEDKRLLEKMDLDFRRNGLALPDDKLAELKELKKKLTNISIEFSRSIAEGIISIDIYIYIYFFYLFLI